MQEMVEGGGFKPSFLTVHSGDGIISDSEGKRQYTIRIFTRKRALSAFFPNNSQLYSHQLDGLRVQHLGLAAF